MARLANINRGTTYPIEGTYLDDDGSPVDISSADIFFTVKTEAFDSDDDDSDALIKKDGTIVSGPDGTYQITLSADDTYVAPGNHYYSIKIDVNGNNNDIKLLASGRVKVVGNTTNRKD